MATALLYPQDCLAPSWRHANRRFASASEGEKARYASLPDEAELGLCQDRRPRETAGGRGAPGGSSSRSVGLLPLPCNVSPSFYSTLCRSSGRHRGPCTQRSLPYPQKKRCRLPASPEYRASSPTQRPVSLSQKHMMNDRLRCRGPTELRSAMSLWSQGEMAASSLCVEEASLHSQSFLPPKACPSPSHLYDTVNEQQNRSPPTLPAQGVFGYVDSGKWGMHLPVRKPSTPPEDKSRATDLEDLALRPVHGPVRASVSEKTNDYFILSFPNSDGLSLIPSPWCKSKSENDGHDRLASASAQDFNCWMAAVDERWAGPSFSNSPHPSTLPVPKFASKPFRTSSAPESVNSGTLLSNCFAQTIQIDHAAFATKHLRQLLQLDGPRL